MRSSGSNFDLKTLAAGLLKQLLIWGPIVVGVVHQFVMFFWGIDRIYVYLKPPEYISPFVTLEIEWWFVLTLLSSLLCLLTYAERLHPHRLIYPFYIYLLFLLILVKPV